MVTGLWKEGCFERGGDTDVSDTASLSGDVHLSLWSFAGASTGLYEFPTPILFFCVINYHKVGSLKQYTFIL